MMLGPGDRSRGSPGSPLSGLVSPGQVLAGRDHQQVGLVQDRHRNLRRARVVGADVDHHVRVVHRAVGVGRFGLGRPLAGAGRGVVPVGIDHLELARLPAGFFQRDLDAVDDRVGLGLGAAGARQAGDDLDPVRVSVGRSAPADERGDRQQGDEQDGRQVTRHRQGKKRVKDRLPPASVRRILSQAKSGVNAGRGGGRQAVDCGTENATADNSTLAFTRPAGRRSARRRWPRPASAECP